MANCGNNLHCVCPLLKSQLTSATFAIASKSTGDAWPLAANLHCVCQLFKKSFTCSPAHSAIASKSTGDAWLQESFKRVPASFRSPQRDL
eukprot:5564768-Karenia_brevis.AAC.1